MWWCGIVKYFYHNIYFLGFLESTSSGTNGTVLEDVPEEKQQECCISEETAINLGKLSIKV